ncbi:MAG: hypothetical protein HY850_02470 [Betaproteobacteria bacterium]|nr:hypothetical protein [Betaproteobacteria bacterium]
MPAPAASAISGSSVCRLVALAEGQTARIAAVAEQLRRLDGVSDVELRGAARLWLRYDAALIGYSEIERALDGAGLRRRTNLGWRLRSAWYRFLDENIQSNARTRSAACCSHPPAGAGDRHGDAEG